MHGTDLIGIAVTLDQASRPVSMTGSTTLLSPEESSELLGLSMRLSALRRWLMEGDWDTMYHSANGAIIRDTIINSLKRLGFNQYCIAYIMDMICAYEEHCCMPTRREYTMLSRYAPKSWYYTLFHSKQKHSNDNAWKTVLAHKELVRKFPFSTRVANILKYTLSNLDYVGNKMVSPTEEMKVRMRTWGWDGRGPMRKEFLELLRKVEENQYHLGRCDKRLSAMWVVSKV